MADDILKRCTTCRLSPPEVAFAADARASDGLQSRCRSCANAQRRARYAADPIAAQKRQRDYYTEHGDAVRASNARSRTKHKDRIAARKKAEYERDKHKPEFIARIKARVALTRDQKREYDRQYRISNAAKLEALKTAWRAANADLIRAVKSAYKARRRAAELAGDTPRQVSAWLARIRKVCLWCEVDCTQDFHIDHFTPLALGGEHRVSNLAIACPTCNVRKNALPPEEFCRRMGFNFAAILERHRVDIGIST